MKRDGHIHSPYCPHGTTDTFEQYIEKAIQQGFTDISFTEHAPAPNGFFDTTPEKDSFMTMEQFHQYIAHLSTLKEQYKHKIRIRIGLEIDFIEGYEQQTTAFLNTYGPMLDDAILSVHFLKYKNDYVCIDFSEDLFIDFAKQVGSVENVYKLYYDTVQQSIRTSLCAYKPKRIGHPTLVHKFQLAHGEKIDDDTAIRQTLSLMREFNLELDVNSAGLAKKHCQESYPPPRYVAFANELHIPIVFGSDAHQAKDLHQFYDTVFN